MEKNKYYLTNAKHKSLIDEIKYLEQGEGSQLLAKLLASSPGSGMGRPNDLPAHILAGELLGYLQEIKTVTRQAVIIDEVRDQELNLNKIVVGSTVYLQYDGDDEIVEYTILGQKEVDIDAGKISCFSPIGSTLIDKCKGEKVIIKVPGSIRDIQLKILEIKRLPLDFQYGHSRWKEKLENALMM